MPSKNAVQGGRGLLCPKCAHLNPSDLKECEYCNSQLFVKCKICGAMVQRVLSRCGECNHRLKKSSFRKLKRKMFRRSHKITIWQFALLIVVAFVAYKAIQMASGKL